MPKMLPGADLPAPDPGMEDRLARLAKDWLKDVDLQLEVERYEKAFGHQHVDRADG